MIDPEINIKPEIQRFITSDYSIYGQH